MKVFLVGEKTKHLEVSGCPPNASHWSNDSLLSLHTWTDLDALYKIETRCGYSHLFWWYTLATWGLLKWFWLTFRGSCRLFFCLSLVKLGVLILLRLLACVLHRPASIGPLATFSGSFRTLIAKDLATFRKRPTYVSLRWAFKATITV